MRDHSLEAPAKYIGLLDRHAEMLDPEAAARHGWYIAHVAPDALDDVLTNLWQWSRSRVYAVCPEMTEELRALEQRRPDDPDWAYAGKVQLESVDDFAQVFDQWEWSGIVFEASYGEGIVYWGVERDVSVAGSRDFVNSVAPVSLRIPKRGEGGPKLP